EVRGWKARVHYCSGSGGFLSDRRLRHRTGPLREAGTSGQCVWRGPGARTVDKAVDCSNRTRRTMNTPSELFVKSHVARDLLQNATLFKTDKLVVWEYVANGLRYIGPGTNPLVRVSLD